MVLALLVLEANRVVSVDRLLDWVWRDEAEPRNAATLQVYMSNLRRALAEPAVQLGRPLIATRRPGYAIDLEDGESDLLAFESLRRSGEAAAKAGRPGEAVNAFRSALALWRDAPLSGLPLGVQADGIVERLELTRAATCEQLAGAELAVGRHRDVITELQAWVRDYPLDERLRGHLMLALYRSGRQADALAVYKEGRGLLVDQLGIDPSRDLRELETRILNQDPALDLVATRREVASGQSTELRTSARLPAATIEVEGRSIPLDRHVMTIGRLPDRDIVLPGSRVSRAHGELRRSGQSFRIVDCGSANGTFVNGVPIADQLLVDGDVIQIGDVELTFNSAPIT
jgi:DNA-binding SARP family transcriptional activator